jgi:hypothetical protein
VDHVELPDFVKVRVFDRVSGREAAWSDGLVEKLKDRAEEIRTAIIAGATAVAVDLDSLAKTSQWQADQLTIAFGLSLTAESGVVVTKAALETTFDVSVSFRRA